MDQIETRITWDKLGGAAVRFGRYKLIRYNPPKDRRTGKTIQHENRLEGNRWLEANPEDRCTYDLEGNLENPGCSIEPDCRNFTTFGLTNCMRDHYYQLYDLELNFGEKMSCHEQVPNESQFWFKTPSMKLTKGSSIGNAVEKIDYIDLWGVG